MNARRVWALIVVLAWTVCAGCSPSAQEGTATSDTVAETNPGVEATPTSGTASAAPTEGAAPETGADVVAATGVLEISLTDAPPVLDLEQVLITLSDVKVHRAGGEAEAGWFTVVDTAQTFDLIALRDARALLGSTELEEARYTQIRLTVDEAVATIDGAEHALKIPSGTIRLAHTFEIEAGQTTELTLDFDAEQSIHAAGRQYMMRPVIRVIAGGPAP